MIVYYNDLMDKNKTSDKKIIEDKYVAEMRQKVEKFMNEKVKRTNYLKFLKSLTKKKVKTLNDFYENIGKT
jgi:hypothetical protein